MSVLRPRPRAAQAANLQVDGPVDLLRRVSAALRAGEAISPVDAEPLTAAIAQFLSGEVEHLDVALGLQARRGQRSIGTALSIDLRNRLLRSAAVQFFPQRSVSQQSQALAQAIARYRSTAWLRERASDSCPVRHEGRLEAHIWKLLRAWDADLSAERVRKILVAADGFVGPSRQT